MTQAQRLALLNDRIARYEAISLALEAFERRVQAAIFRAQNPNVIDLAQARRQRAKPGGHA